MSCFKQNRPSDLISEADWSIINQPTLMDLFLLPETTNEMRIEILNKALNTIKCVYLENGLTIGTHIDTANNLLKEAFENPTPKTVAFIPAALSSFVGARDLDDNVAKWKQETNNSQPPHKLKPLFLILTQTRALAKGGSIFNVFGQSTNEEDNQALADAIKAGNKVDTGDYELSGGTKKKGEDNAHWFHYGYVFWGGVAVTLGGAYILLRKK